MVQRKADYKLRTKPESKISIKSEKRSVIRHFQNQDIRGGCELKKKMKKVRSFNVTDFGSFGSPLKQEHLKFNKPIVHGSSPDSTQKLIPTKIPNRSPNYMKPTSNSDARKESSQVSTRSRITDKKNSKFSMNSRHGGRGSQPKSPSGSGLKPKRVLTKTSVVSSFPKLNVNRATCSSTLKDYKFPTSVVLNPGGSEYDGTSVMKVCPYTYCSLNGHHHAPLPPLKHFLSARRRLLRTQKKSMRLCPFMAKKEIDTGQIMETGFSSISEADRAGLSISTLIEEDFLVEIYMAPMVEPEESSDYENRKICSEGHDEQKLDMESVPEVFDELSNVTFDEITCESETEKDFRKVVESELEEDDFLDQDHDFHVAEMDDHVPVNFSEYCDSGWVLEERDLSNELNYKQADQPELGCESWVRSHLDEDCESMAETQLGESIEASDMDWEAPEASYPDNEIDDHKCSDDGSDSVTVSLPRNLENITEELSFEPENQPKTCMEAPEDAEVLQDGRGEHIGSFLAAICGNAEGEETESDSGEVFDMCNGQTQNQNSEFLDLSHTQVKLEAQETEEINMSGSTEVIVYSSIVLNSTDYASQKHAIREENDENPQTDTIRSNDNKGYLGELDCNSDFEGKITMDEQLNVKVATIIQDCDSLQDDLETDQKQINPVIDGEALPDADLGDRTEMKEQDNNANGLLDFQISDSHQGDAEIEQDIAEEYQDAGKTNTEIEVEHGHVAFCDHNMLLEENKQLDAAETFLDPTIIQDCDSPEITMDEQLAINGATIIQDCDSLQDDLETDQSQINPVIDGEETQIIIASDQSAEQALPNADLGDRTEMKEQDSNAHGLLEFQISDSLQDDLETDQSQINPVIDGEETQIIIASDQSAEQALPNADLGDRTEMKEQDSNAHGLLEFQISDSHQGDPETEQSIDEKDHDPGKANREIKVEDSQEAFMLLEENKQLETEETCLDPTEDGKITNNGTSCNQQLAGIRSNLRERINIKRKVAIEDRNRDKKFDPRGPRFLAIEPNPEAEQVDLRHQMMDERKSAEEWMVDYALRQAVTKLTPARKRRVALLVEAFETVMPPPKWETHLQHSTASFTHARPIQACS